MNKKIVTALLAVGLLLACAPASSAATLTRDANGILIFTAAPGETNNIDIFEWTFTSVVAIGDSNNSITDATNSGCVIWFGAYWDCTSMVGDPSGFRIVLADGNDVSRANQQQADGLCSPDCIAPAIPVTILGGDGNDTLNGLASNDRLEGGEGNDILNGGAGNDLLNGGLHTDVMNGGNGSVDIVTYAGRTDAITVNLASAGADDGATLDGGAGSRDTINNTDVEGVVGGSGADTLSGAGLAFALRIRGGAGNDSITGGADTDVLGGGLGNDAISAAGGGDDDVFCGVGVDNAASDASDTREACEPTTAITQKPARNTGSRSATFKYSSTTPTATFQCKLDGGAWAACSAAGKTYSSLARGAHTFRVRAKDLDGSLDPTPAAYSWRIT